jgi:hypothetical protein
VLRAPKKTEHLETDHSPQSPTVTLTGSTARAALDELIVLDPRYRRLVSDGVLVFRPL